MIRLVRTALLATLAMSIACGWATTNRDFYLGTGSDRCLDSDSNCHASKDCCSAWCVNGVCEYKP